MYFCFYRLHEILFFIIRPLKHLVFGQHLC